MKKIRKIVSIFLALGIFVLNIPYINIYSVSYLGYDEALQYFDFTNAINNWTAKYYCSNDQALEQILKGTNRNLIIRIGTFAHDKGKSTGSVSVTCSFRPASYQEYVCTHDYSGSFSWSSSACSSVDSSLSFSEAYSQYLMCWTGGSSNCAFPGKSDHNSGNCMDVSGWLQTDVAIGSSELSNYGLVKNVSSENWHISVNDSSLSGYDRYYNALNNGYEIVLIPCANTGSYMNKGATVALVQKKLQSLGYNITIDGLYGSGTASVVAQYQSDNGLVSDGICGNDTLRSLFPEFYSGTPVIVDCGCSTDYAGNYTVTTESTDLNMRSDHNSSSSIVTKIPKGATVYVSKANGSWAHVEYNGYTGFCSMQYLTKIEPPPVVPSKPEYLAISDCNSMTNVTLSWSPCENTDYYDIRCYNTDGVEVNSVWGVTNTYYITNLPYGNYYFNVASVNNNGNYTFSDNFSFSISKGDLVPTSIETYNNHIYALYDVMTTYENATLYATALGGHLATITSEEESNFIVNFKDTGSFKRYWLGATDVDNEGTWKWCTGEEFSYSNWDTGQPDNCIGTYSNENYLEIWENGYWNDSINCNSDARGFIIEIEPLTEIKSKEYNNHTYYVFDNTLSWTEANQYAQNMGGYLVEIDNQAENDFIQSLIQDTDNLGYWISLNDTGYTNFNDGEPNNTAGIENYYHIYTNNGKWNDADNCQGLNCSIGFIVEVNTVSQKEIKLNKSKLALQENETYQLELLNADNLDKIIWISSDTSIATVTDGLVTAISNGDVTIYAIINDVSIKCNLKVYPYQENTMLGDCNNNGNITVIDLLLLKRYILGVNVGNTINIYNSDINNDGNINVLDTIALKQILI